jgi:hypothetical protein
MASISTFPRPHIRPHVLTSAEEIIVQAQEILAAYRVPNSGVSDGDCINRLLEVLDGPEAIEIYETVSARREGGYKSH